MKPTYKFGKNRIFKSTAIQGGIKRFNRCENQDKLQYMVLAGLFNREIISIFRPLNFYFKRMDMRKKKIPKAYY